MANVFPIGEYAEAYNVAVDGKYRKKGIGTKLGDFLEKHLRKMGIEMVYGYVNDDNKPAQKLAEKNGYEKGKKEIFYSKFLKQSQ
ncbi:GNAT family N-acetyltransferase [Candidatus Pacearchaeota archaeon]|nr:GNAT family N-acetyltransferase [Candidatus Pacearchaeota archaeon]